MAESDTFDISANQAFMRSSAQKFDTTGPAQCIISSGAYMDSSGVYHTIYPDGHTRWPAWHYHHYYPWPAPQPQGLIAGSTHGPEKPHETVQRAMQEIAAAARELARSAREIGVPVDQRALEEALIEKLREAL